MRRLIATVFVAAAALAGCGGDDTVGAESLVDALNEAGANLVLGEPIEPAEGQVELRTLQLGGPEGASEGTDDHGAGAIVVMPDETAATAEFARCDSAISFICFRAANAVLRFSAITPDEQEQLSDALRVLAGETG